MIQLNKQLILLTCISLMCFALRAQSPSAKKIMIKNDKESVANNEYMKTTMTLTNKKGGKRVRVLEQYSKLDKGGNRSLLIKFLSPIDIMGTGFLSIENPSRSDDQWLYLPAFDKTRRISGSSETDYFVGSDFTFEDLNREDIPDFNYKLLGETDFEGAACYKIEAIPSNETRKKESGYSKRVLLIRKDNYVTAKADFYDKKGILLKTFTAKNIKKVNDSWRAFKMEMKNLRTLHSTTLVYDQINLNTSIEAEKFTERSLTKK